MAIYAIGDLHLSLNNEKPMDIFGTKWESRRKNKRKLAKSCKTYGYNITFRRPFLENAFKRYV